jgi:hypothetical protein
MLKTKILRPPLQQACAAYPLRLARLFYSWEWDLSDCHIGVMSLEIFVGGAGPHQITDISVVARM